MTSKARAGPTSAVNRSTAPPPGTMPTPTSGCPNRARSKREFTPAATEPSPNARDGYRRSVLQTKCRVDEVRETGVGRGECHGIGVREIIPGHPKVGMLTGEHD